MDEQDYLCHYGVLGMKWGIHKARKNGTEYKYRSAQTKHHEKKAAKYAEKGKMDKANKHAEYAKRSAELDSVLEKRARKMSGKETALRYILTPGHLLSRGSHDKAVSVLEQFSTKKISGKAESIMNHGLALASSMVVGPWGASGLAQIMRDIYVKNPDLKLRDREN